MQVSRNCKYLFKRTLGQWWGLGDCVMKIGTFTAVLVSFPHFLSVFMYHLCSFCTGCLKRWLDFVLVSQSFCPITMAAFGDFCPNCIWDKSQIWEPTSKNSEKIESSFVMLERTYKPYYDYQNLSPSANGTYLNRQKYAILQTHWH